MNQENQNIEYKGGVLVTFQRNNVNLKMTDGTQIGIPQDGVEHVVEKLTERQKDILRLITQNAHITAKEIGTAIGVSDSTINRETDWMQEKGILSRTTKNRYGKWVILLPTQDE